MGLELHLRGAFGKNNSELDIFVGNTFILLGAFQEWYVQDKAIAALELPQELGAVGIPAYTEWIVPATKDWVPGLKLQQSFTLIAPELRSRDITDGIGIVWVQAADSQWER